MEKERMEILKKIQEKEISLDEGLKQLEELDQKEVSVVTRIEDNISKKVFRIKVISSDGDKVSVNLPFDLLKVFNINSLEGKININNKANNFFKDAVDFDKLYEMVESGLLGELVDIESADGDIVKIFVE